MRGGKSTLNILLWSKVDLDLKSCRSCETLQERHHEVIQFDDVAASDKVSLKV